MARTTDEHVRKLSPNVSNRVILFHFIHYLLVGTSTNEEESVICAHRMLKMWEIHESFLHFVHDFILFVVYYWVEFEAIVFSRSAAREINFCT